MFWGTPSPFGVGQIALVNLQCVKKFQGAAPPNGRNVVSRKMPTWMVSMSPYNFSVCGPNFKYFFRPTWNGFWLIKYFSDLQYVDPFRRYSQSNSKVVRNCVEFWTLFSPPPQILGGGPSKTYTHFITPGSRHVAQKKFCEDTPSSAEVIGAHTLNFKPNFKF